MTRIWAPPTISYTQQRITASIMQDFVLIYYTLFKQQQPGNESFDTPKKDDLDDKQQEQDGWELDILTKSSTKARELARSVNFMLLLFDELTKNSFHANTYTALIYFSRFEKFKYFNQNFLVCFVIIIIFFLMRL